nr:MAG: hypothetical protein TU35_09800 [Thermoproteus sp. AZ2]
MVDWGGFFIPNIQTFTKYGLYTYFNQPPYFLQVVPNWFFIGNSTYPWNLCVLHRAVAMIVNATPMSQIAEMGYILPCKDPLCIRGTIYESAWSKYINWTTVQQYGWVLGTYQNNTAAAAQLLESAGFYKGPDGYWRTPNGTLVTATIIVPYGWTDSMEDAELLAEQLNAFGIKATTSFPAAGTEFNDIYTGEFIIGYLWAWSGVTPYPYFQELMYPTGTNGALVPVGTSTWGDYGRWYVNGHYIWEVFENLSYVPLTDYEAQQKYFTEIEKAYLECPPVIPGLLNAQWYEYSTVYWVGWPNASNPAPVNPPAWSPPQDVINTLNA